MFKFSVRSASLLLNSLFLSKYSHCEDWKVTKGGMRIDGLPNTTLNMQKLESANINGRKLYHTKTHHQLVDLLVNSSEFLVKDGYVDDTCSHSKLIKGMKGIGKSSVLKTFTKSSLFPNVIKLYISCDGVWSPGQHILQEKNILNMIESQLMDRNIIVEPRKGNESLGDSLTSALEKEGLYVLLIIDEFEELYRLSPEDRLNALIGPQVKGSLHTLQWLLGQDSGRFLVMLCGSSANCANLVALAADHNEFPGQTQAPKLNGTKLSPFTVSVPTFNDIDTIRCLLKDMGLPCSEKEARLMAFGVGAIARNVKRLSESMTNGGSSSVFELARSTLDDKLTVGMSAAESMFLKALLTRTRCVNKALLDQLSDKTTNQLDANLVMEVDWEKQFQPLSCVQVQEVWRDLCAQHVHLFKDLNMQHVLLSFRDRGVFQLDQAVVSATFNQYYPMCLADVFLDADQEYAEAIRTNFRSSYDHFDLLARDVVVRAREEVVEGVGQALGEKLTAVTRKK